MIVEDIKNSIKEAIYGVYDDIIFHFEDIKHTGYPFANLSLKDFKIEPSSSYDKQKNEFTFELLYVKSRENTISELLSVQKSLSDALLPVITVNNKKITPENVLFYIENKTLFMNFKLSFYTYEKEDIDSMEILDITLKEN